MILLLGFVSWALSATCSVGSDRYIDLVKIFNKDRLATEDSFLNAYRIRQTIKETPGLKSYVPEAALKSECLKISMQRIPKISAKRKICESSSDMGRTFRIIGVTAPSKFSSADQIGRDDLCLEDDMLDYISWGYGEAIRCINSLPTNKKNDVFLSAVSIFEIFNNETAYGFYLYSNRGLGAGQLTNSAVGDFLPNQRFNFFLKEIADSTSPSCTPFKEMIKRPVQFSGSNIRNCQFLSITEGIGRNFLYSSLHLASREWEIISMLKAKGYKTEKIQRRIIDQLLSVAYSRHGLDGVQRIIARKLPLETMSPEQFYNQNYRAYPYLAEVRDKMLEFLSKYNTQMNTNATYEDYQDGLCASE